MNHLGTTFQHTVVALDRDFSAAKRVREDITGQTNAIARLMRQSAVGALMNQHRPDLVLTYNWGAIDGVVAALVPPRIPTIHTEDGFGIDEAIFQKRRRVLMRRLVLYALTACACFATLLKSCVTTPCRSKILYLYNGVDSNLFFPASRRPQGIDLVRNSGAVASGEEA